MSDINDEIRSEIDAFVNRLSALVRRSALEAISGALGGGVEAPAAKAAAQPAKKTAGKAAPKKAAAKAAAPAKAPAKPGARPLGAKRPPEEIAKLTAKVHEYIRANPGHGVEGIAKALDTPTKDLTLPIKKLIADNKITFKGHRRATKYFPR